MHISTFITADSIVTRFSAHSDVYTLVTVRIESNKYKSKIIKSSDYKNALWSVEEDTTMEAAIAHIALFNMANEEPVLHWNENIFNANKNKQIVEVLQLNNALAFAKDNTLNSEFTRHLCKAAGMDVTRTSIEIDNKKILGLIAALVALSAGLSMDW